MRDISKRTFTITNSMLSGDKKVVGQEYIRRGAKVLLLHGIDEAGSCRCGGKCKSPGKHPISELFPHGHKSATKDQITFNSALRKHPDANLAIVLPENLVVLDCDTAEAVDALKALGMPLTASVKTSRGMHFYVRTSTPDIFNALKIPNLDVKTSNGYVVAPPSRHASGAIYQFNQGETKIASWTAPSSRTTTKKATLLPTKGIPEGSRNQRLTSVGGFLRAQGFAEATIASALLAVNESECRPVLPESEVRRIAQSVAGYDVDPDDYFKALDDVKVEEIEWLLKPYIVRGAMTILDGDPGLGKSTFTTGLAAAITLGRSLPFAEIMKPGRVLFMSAEDDPGRVLKPRLLENSADISRIRIQSEHFTLDQLGVSRLREELDGNPVDLVVIDPLMAFMEIGLNSNSTNDAMHFMMDLDKVARDYNCAILVVRHLRKSGGDNPMARGLGSISINARVRSALVLARHPDDRELRAVAHYKSSYAKEGPTVLFELKASTSGFPKISWKGTDDSLTGEHLLREPDRADRGRPPNELEHAKVFLHEILRSGPREKTEIMLAADAKGITEATLRRAREDIGVVFAKRGKQSWWEIPIR
ncbi:AAA family ATPase [Tabrizicola sp. BL-A-41-H6]|uniref:AAA family ATPase n=1 Tax=Tabrizicola sp. BL-A-41-H6 TaxID=3421107 RepID=UPI003D677DC1